jgi:hypothetical protein
LVLASALISELLQPAQVPFRSAHALALRWTDQRRLDAEVAAAKAEMVEAYGRFISALIGRGRLTEVEARMLPAQIDVRITDDRTNRTPSLREVN